MGDFINTIGTGSNPENLVLLDEVTIDEKEGQRTFMYGSNSGLRRLSEEVPWAWKKAWPRGGSAKNIFWTLPKLQKCPNQFGKGGHPQIGQCPK